MNKKLSVKMQYALDKMEFKKWYSSYDLGVSLRTLDALVDRGLVARRHTFGSSFFPHNNIYYMKKENINE